MLPFVFEWQWDIGHLVFMGFFALSLMILGGTLLFCLFLTYKDLILEEQAGEPEYRQVDIPKLPLVKKPPMF